MTADALKYGWFVQRTLNSCSEARWKSGAQGDSAFRPDRRQPM